MRKYNQGKKNSQWKDLPCADEHWLRRQYLTEDKSLRQIAREIGCSFRTVARYIEKYSIIKENKYRKGNKHPSWQGGPKKHFCKCGAKKNRDYNKTCAKCYHKSISGENNPNYKGVADIKVILRSFFATNLRETVFKRDDYTCQECGDCTRGNLNAHHVAEFSIIVDTLLKKYKSEDLEDPSNRIKIAKELCEHEWLKDLDNIITLCDKCHDRIHHFRKTNCFGNCLYRYQVLDYFVVDGDTVYFSINLGFGITFTDTFRLFGINAPEMRGKTKKQGEETKKALTEFLENSKLIEIITFKNKKNKTKRGKYGRWLGIIICDGRNINKELLKRNLAVEY